MTGACTARVELTCGHWFGALYRGQPLLSDGRVWFTYYCNECLGHRRAVRWRRLMDISA